MKRILIAIPVIFLSVTSAYALDPGCNTAIQNWQNGSKTTCPPDNAGGQTDEVIQRFRKHCYHGEESRKDGDVR